MCPCITIGPQPRHSTCMLSLHVAVQTAALADPACMFVCLWPGRPCRCRMGLVHTSVVRRQHCWSHWRESRCAYACACMCMGSACSDDHCVSCVCSAITADCATTGGRCWQALTPPPRLKLTWPPATHMPAVVCMHMIWSGQAPCEAPLSSQRRPLRLPHHSQQRGDAGSGAHTPAARPRLVCQLWPAQQQRHQAVLHQRPRQQALHCGGDHEHPSAGAD
jgi:hypothetical protein